MRSILSAALVILLIPALMSCGSTGDSGYHGALYFGQGSYLLRVSLRDGNLTVIDNLGDTTIRDLSPYGNDMLLIAETASINRREVSRISWLNLKTGQSAALYSGVLARYLADAGVIVYDDGLKLFAVSQQGMGTDEIVFSHRQNQLSTLIEVANDTLLFESGETGERTIYAWNAMTGDLQRLDSLSATCRLNGAVWIDTLGQLACKQRANANGETAYVLADLDGVTAGTLDLPSGKRFLALTFIAGQNALILRETRESFIGNQKKSSIWAYNIENHESLRLVRNQNPGTSVVYTEY